MRYKVLVTDITQYGSLYCVAGWDIDHGGMVRPEPATSSLQVEASRFWTAELAGPGRIFSERNVVLIEADAPPAVFPFPHATEDRIVRGGSMLEVVGTMTVQESLQVLAAGTSRRVPDAFDGGLVRRGNGKGSVAEGHRGRSLGAIDVPVSNLILFEETDGNKAKLRAWLDDESQQYNFSVTSDELRTLWREVGCETLQAQIRLHHRRLHVRLGLARAFADQGCMGQINGVFGY